jgi:hypothetical protein
MPDGPQNIAQVGMWFANTEKGETITWRLNGPAGPRERASKRDAQAFEPASNRLLTGLWRCQH